ncbi:hypothetical protein CBI55_26880, partial [Pseudomonas syringae]
ELMHDEKRKYLAMIAGLAQEMLHVNLENCADEPIHVPGTIQAHGAMLVFDSSARLEAWSANVNSMLDFQLHAGMSLASVRLPELVQRMIEECIATRAEEAMPSVLAVDIGGHEFDCVVHAYHNRSIVEFELRDVSLDTVGIFAL